MPAPVPLAMVVCDGFYKDSFTSKHTLIGTFSAISGPRFPLRHPHLTVYLALTNGHGKTPLLLQMLDAEENREPVFQFEGPVQFDDPRDVIEICFQTQEIWFPEPGEYRLKLIAGGEFLIERKLLVSGPAIPADFEP